ncbi:uncharacterized protein LDX57_009424 [Aspergillus melleus]|uniref:uncharacterized protein n=1 Tax=Aspergillus melleus TaxID=138277 RepID=UPI001E8D8AE7|nr:uncharacterized protein LDX57_009424 [Aspergillus melleus]KAH8431771.1 hypothetical protein LDX57_009424 [Aspergillus melleus]
MARPTLLSSLLTSFIIISSIIIPFITAAATGADASATETSCNGQPAYCDRKYSNTTYLGAHDSPFVGPLPQHNQNLNVTAQLDFGIRYLQGQTHKIETDDAIRLCHTSCLLEDAGTLESFLVTVKTWLEGHPDEVLTLLLTNGDGVPVSKFDETFTKADIKKYAFVPEPASEVLPIGSWPTLGEMISKGKRLVVFLDYGADVATVPYILDEFAYYFETPFGVTDRKFPNCSIDRPPNANADGRMYIVNHFLDVDILGVLIPDRLRAPRTNAVSGDGSIGAQANLCNSKHGRLANVILVDFVDQGQVIAAQNKFNGF